MEWKYLNSHTAFDYLYYIMLGKDVNNIQSVNLFFVNMVQNSEVGKGGFLGKTEMKDDIIFSRFWFLIN